MKIFKNQILEVLHLPEYYLFKLYHQHHHPPGNYIISIIIRQPGTRATR
jgi:hypothetical protein